MKTKKTRHTVKYGWKLNKMQYYLVFARGHFVVLMLNVSNQVECILSLWTHVLWEVDPLYYVHLFPYTHVITSDVVQIVFTVVKVIINCFECSMIQRKAVGTHAAFSGAFQCRASHFGGELCLKSPASDLFSLVPEWSVHFSAFPWRFCLHTFEYWTVGYCMEMWRVVL